MITEETLRVKLKELEDQLEINKANVSAVAGAIQLCNQLIALEANKEKPKDGKQKV